MGNLDFFNSAIEKKLKDLHTAYLAKVLTVSGNKATVQPLGLIKEYGGATKKQAIVSNIPIATKKITSKSITFVSDATLSGETLNATKKTENIAVVSPIVSGDIVICVCCDRDITDAKNGINGLPALGDHSLSNSVIVGVL